jgi:hypothetical protein
MPNASIRDLFRKQLTTARRFENIKMIQSEYRDAFMPLITDTTIPH